MIKTKIDLTPTRLVCIRVWVLEYITYGEDSRSNETGPACGLTTLEASLKVSAVE